MANKLLAKGNNYLNVLCNEITERCVGSEGNRKATTWFNDKLSSFGWDTKVSEFEAMDWEQDGATIRAGELDLKLHPGPYSLGCKVKALLTSASDISELESVDARNKIILLHGEIAIEQLMPKNFVFYNPDRHKKIVSLLENSGALAIICATTKNPSLAGGVYPFPLIEDGEFDVPSVYMTEEDGKLLIPYIGKEIFLQSLSERIPAKGYNVKGTVGSPGTDRIVVTAHIDAKKGTPGAIDNATGVVVLLLLAEILADYEGDKQIELVAFNGEDYYAVSGQMLYISENQGNFDSIYLNINLDGAGYKEGKSCISFFGIPEDIKKNAEDAVLALPGITEGPQWPQGDHSIFVQFGVPAVAISSKWFIDNIDTQDITHTPKDKPEIVDVSKLVEIAGAIENFIRKL